MIFIRELGSKLLPFTVLPAIGLFWPWLREQIRSKNRTVFYSPTRPPFRAKTDLSHLLCCDWIILRQPGRFIKSHKQSRRKMETSWFYRLRFEFESRIGNQMRRAFWSSEKGVPIPLTIPSLWCDPIKTRSSYSWKFFSTLPRWHWIVF